MLSPLRPGQANSSHNFAQVPKVGLSRTAFDRSSRLTTTFNVDYLVPVFLEEIVPGDTCKLDMYTVARLTTLAVPFMDNLYLDSFFFFVPHRLVWDSSEGSFVRFMGERPDPDSSIDFIVPQIVSPVGGFDNQTLFDYLGWPTKIAGFSASTLPNRSYNLIYNEWFRDQNLQDSVVVDKDNGPDTVTDYVLLKRNKRHDYFTSCLPFPQKGDDVLLPLGSTAPVISDHTAVKFSTTTNNVGEATAYVSSAATNPIVASAVPNNQPAFFGSNTGLIVDLEDATSSTINVMREAVTLQQFLEQDARGGTRYTEIVRSHFNVISPDARLQRPEYLGGGSTMINVSPIAQTSNDGTNGDVGNLAAIGTLQTNGRREGHGFTKSFVEHGYVIGLVNIRADLTYQQGCPRHLSRRTRYDYFWPTFQNLGEQAVLNKEIYAQGTSADSEVFGYQERYAEYRYAPNRITGKIRSNDAASLDVWTLSEDFGSLPVLNSEFVTLETPIDRVTVTSTEPDIRADFLFKLNHVRPMSMFGVPGLTRF